MGFIYTTYICMYTYAHIYTHGGKGWLSFQGSSLPFSLSPSRPVSLSPSKSTLQRETQRVSCPPISPGVAWEGARWTYTHRDTGKTNTHKNTCVL